MNKQETIKKILNSQLYVVTDRKLSMGRSILETVEAAIKGGAGLIQYREKDLSDAEFKSAAEKILSVCKFAEIPLIINDRIKIASQINADGVHIGQDDNSIQQVREFNSDLVIGVSTHDVLEAEIAIKQGADYINIGPVFPTATKEVPMPPVGAAMVKKITDFSSVPVTTMGGINKTNIQEVILAGADRCAVVSAAVSAEDITAACRELIELIKKAKNVRAS